MYFIISYKTWQMSLQSDTFPTTSAIANHFIACKHASLLRKLLVVSVVVKCYILIIQLYNFSVVLIIINSITAYNYPLHMIVLLVIMLLRFIN